MPLTPSAIVLNPGSGGESLASIDEAGQDYQQVAIAVEVGGVMTYIGDQTARFPVETRAERLTPWWEYLSENGAGTVINANGNYTSLKEFRINPGANTKLWVHRLVLTVQGAGSFTASTYGPGLALSNGWEVQTFDSGGTPIHEMNGNFAVKTNGRALGLFRAYTLTQFGSGDGLLVGVWEMPVPVSVDGSASESLRWRMLDNYTGLTEHTMFMEGTTEVV